MYKNGLALSGGSVKGAYQAGVLYSILRKGFVPDFIDGTSIGSLNGLYFTYFAQVSMEKFGRIDGDFIAGKLENLWLQRVTDFNVLGKKRSALDIGWAILRGKFTSLLDMTNLRDLIESEIRISKVKHSPIDFFPGYVNMYSKQMEYGSKESDKLLEQTLASTRIPIIMPLERIDNIPMADAGLRNVTPLASAARRQPDNLVYISCSPKELDYGTFKMGSIIKLLEATIEILTNEVAVNDIESFNEINDLVKLIGSNNSLIQNLGQSNNKTIQRLIKGKYKYIKSQGFEPQEKLEVSIEDFTRQDMAHMFNLGVNDGLKFDLNFGGKN